MRMIKPDDSFGAAARKLQGGDHSSCINAVAVRSGVAAHIFASESQRDGPRFSRGRAENDAATLVRIAALSFPANQVVVSLADLQHRFLLGSGANTPARKRRSDEART